MSVDGTLLGDADPAHIKSLFVSDKVEKMRVTIHPILLGGNSGKSLTCFPDGFLPEDRLFRLKGMEEKSGLAHLHYVRDRRKKN